jgi:hypothetical protein
MSLMEGRAAGLPALLAPSSDEVRRLAGSFPAAASLPTAPMSALLLAAAGCLRGAMKPAAWVPLGEWMVMARRL